MFKIKRKVLFLLTAITIVLPLCFTSVTANAFSIRGLRIVNYAKKFLGVPYVYGATGPNAFDCSGLTSYTYRNALNINIGRTTDTQITKGTPVSKNELEPGDLVFPHTGHVGIYVGNNQFINAPQTGDVVKISSITKFYTGRRIIKANSSIEDLTFNSTFYTSHYSDLNRIFGNNEISLGNHFLNSGIGEGRAASQIFDVKYYLNNNADLKAAFGTNYTTAYNHFLTNGYKENRKISPIFDVNYYLNNNPDVRAQLGTDHFAVINHFLVNGMKEGRQGNSAFNLSTYKSNSPDLVQAFGTNNIAYYNHYLNCGINEERKAN